MEPLFATLTHAFPALMSTITQAGWALYPPKPVVLPSEPTPVVRTVKLKKTTPTKKKASVGALF